MAEKPNARKKPEVSEAAKAEKSGKLSDKEYLKALRKLQVELCELQEWVKYKGLRVIIVF